MAGVNLSGMTVEALMDLRERVDEMLLERRAELQKQWERMKGCPRRWKRFEGKESTAEISGSFRRNLGRSRRKTSLACCCDQGWKEIRRFSNRQVSTKGTEKGQAEALTFV